MTYDAAPVIRDHLVAERQTQLRFLAELVKTPSDNPPGDCAPHADRAADLLEELGHTVERHQVPAALVKANGIISATNLVLRRRFGEGPVIALNAHGDVVPPGEGWTRDPYGAEIVDGWMYGRGVAVSKSDFATYLFALRALEALGRPLAGTVELHFTYDEEAGGEIGPRWLVEQGISRPDYAISAGFSYGVVTAHNGCLHLEVEVIGKSAHAALPGTGIDALEATTQVLTRLYALRQGFPARLSAIAGIGSPQLTVGLIKGGINTNVVPDRVTLRLDRRMIPEENPAAVEAELRAVIGEAVAAVPGARVEIRRILLAAPLTPIAGTERLSEALPRDASRIMGETVEAKGVPLYTDARHYAAAGIPVVLYGAGPHTIEEANAHRADERLPLADLYKATEVIALMLYDLLTGLIWYPRGRERREGKGRQMIEAPRSLLRAMFDAAIAAASPALVLPRHLPTPPRGRTVVVGAGKGTAAMALAVEQHWPGPLSGLVVTRYGHAVPCTRIEVVEARHRVPDSAGREAAGRILAAVQRLTADDLVLCLISGGGSALLALPAPGLALEDKQAVTRDLLRCGATIEEFNCVRKHLSAIKGGRLAAASYPARVVTLAISDVPGDDPSVIASGPSVPDPSTCADALEILERYAVKLPNSVRRHLATPEAETPKPGDPRLAGAETILIATPQDALEAAAAVARRAGFAPVILGNAIEGEARDVALVHAGIARQVADWGQPASAPVVLLSGGETTVTIRGQGRGGRNAEFLLALAVALNGYPRIHALAADTDGIDGSEDNAGAFLAPDTLARALASGLDAKARLRDNDAYSFFSALGDLLVTGPTLTNVNDFRAVLVTG